MREGLFPFPSGYEGTFTDETLCPTYRKPFVYLDKGPSCTFKLSRLDEFRNYMQHEPDVKPTTELTKLITV